MGWEARRERGDSICGGPGARQAFFGVRGRNRQKKKERDRQPPIPLWSLTRGLAHRFTQAAFASSSDFAVLSAP